MWHRLIRHESNRHTKEIREWERWKTEGNVIPANVAEMCIFQIINKSKLIIKWKRKAGRFPRSDSLLTSEIEKSREKTLRSIKMTNLIMCISSAWGLKLQRYTKLKLLPCIISSFFFFFLLVIITLSSSFNLISFIALGYKQRGGNEEEWQKVKKIQLNLMKTRYDDTAERVKMNSMWLSAWLKVHNSYNAAIFHSTRLSSSHFYREWWKIEN